MRDKRRMKDGGWRGIGGERGDRSGEIEQVISILFFFVKTTETVRKKNAKSSSNHTTLMSNKKPTESRKVGETLKKNGGRENTREGERTRGREGTQERQRVGEREREGETVEVTLPKKNEHHACATLSHSNTVFSACVSISEGQQDSSRRLRSTNERREQVHKKKSIPVRNRFFALHRCAVCRVFRLLFFLYVKGWTCSASRCKT